MAEFTIETIGELIKHRPHSDSLDSDVIFRGLSNSDHKLVPSLFRGGFPFTGGGWEGYEQEIIELFQRDAIPYLNGNVPTAPLDWIVLAQHHGLPTRLLDWTRAFL